MPSFELTGMLHKKFETENKTETFQAREFVVTTNDNNYMQYVKFQLVQDKCAMIDTMNEGDEIKVTFDLRGREWQGKFFTNLNAWKVEGSSAAVPPPVNNDFPTLEDAPVAETTSSTDNGAAEMDDLPF